MGRGEGYKKLIARRYARYTGLDYRDLMQQQELRVLEGCKETQDYSYSMLDVLRKDHNKHMRTIKNYSEYVKEQVETPHTIPDNDFRDMVIDFHRVIESLTDDEKELILLRLGVGEGPKELAPIYKVSASRVSQMVSEIVSKLAKRV